MLQYILIAVSTLASEDLASIGAGLLAADRRISLTGAILAAALGIWAGDLMLLAVGRIAGRKLLPKFVSGDRIARASDWLEARGFWAILGSRFVPGLRLPMYLIAGSLPTDLGKFALYLLAAAAIWTPMLVAAASIAGAHGAMRVQNIVVRVALAGICGLALRWIVVKLANPLARRRAAGWFKRVTSWEFWPVWAVYLPLVPWLVILAIRYRSIRVFLCSNPGIPLSGLVGESKSAILEHLKRSGRVAPFLVVEKCAPRQTFPVVAKPDVGERGRDVKIIRNEAELAEYLELGHKTILQVHVSGVEFGVLYYRRPGDESGRVISITEKTFPSVTGDGKRSIRELILADRRAVALEPAYAANCRRDLNDVPEPGERCSLVEIGSHCRGAIFCDASTLITPELERGVDEVAKSHPGFYIGRFDVRTPSVAAFQAGEFTVLELNGVAGEPTHVYDPEVSIISAYGAMYRHWAMAAYIGAKNMQSGASLPGFRDLSRIITVRSWREFVPSYFYCLYSLFNTRHSAGADTGSSARTTTTATAATASARATASGRRSGAATRRNATDACAHAG